MPTILLKKRPWLFSCEFCEFCKNTFSDRTPLMAAFYFWHRDSLDKKSLLLNSVVMYFSAFRSILLFYCSIENWCEKFKYFFIESIKSGYQSIETFDFGFAISLLLLLSSFFRSTNICHKTMFSVKIPKKVGWDSIIVIFESFVLKTNKIIDDYKMNKNTKGRDLLERFTYRQEIISINLAICFLCRNLKKMSLEIVWFGEHISSSCVAVK